MDAFSFSFALQSEACLRVVVWSNDFDAIGYDVYINCGYTDTILIVSKKKYGRDKAVGYISFVVVVVVVVRLWSFGFVVPLFVSFRERTFALVSTTTTTFTTTRCLERFLSLSLCVFFLRRFLCVERSTFCHSFSRLVVLVWGKRHRETHIFHACGGGGGVTCRRHISSRSPRNRPRTSSASNRTNWLPFYLRRAVLSPLSKSPSRLVPNTFSRF